jgi:hypothetical protein
MIIRRIYSPEQIAALRRDIRKRYTRKCEVGKRTRPMAAIRIAELTRWLDHVYGDGRPIGIEDSRAEAIARIFVHHFVTLKDGNRRAAAWLGDYCPWMSTRDREYLITQANHCPLKWTADKLAWKIGLTDAVRAKLKITTVGAIDCSKEQRQARQRQRRAERDKARNAAKRTASSEPLT